jgi:hypothetical protein
VAGENPRRARPHTPLNANLCRHQIPLSALHSSLKPSLPKNRHSTQTQHHLLFPTLQNRKCTYVLDNNRSRHGDGFGYDSQTAPNSVLPAHFLLPPERSTNLNHAAPDCAPEFSLVDLEDGFVSRIAPSSALQFLGFEGRHLHAL